MTLPYIFFICSTVWSGVGASTGRPSVTTYPGNVTTATLGHDHWIGPANALAVANSLPALTWNDSLIIPVAQQAASVTQDNITSETRAYCGLPAQSDTVRICVDMEARENPVTSLLLGLQRIALSDPATYQQDMYVGDPDWMPIGYYLFAGPVPVSIGCMMINCVPVTSVKMCCVTNATRSVAREFDYTTQRKLPKSNNRSCRPYAYDKGNKDSFLPMWYNKKNNVSMHEILCWYTQVPNASVVPTHMAVPCKDSPAAAPPLPQGTCATWDQYVRMDGVVYYDVQANQRHVDDVVMALGIPTVPYAACMICCYNGLQNSSDCYLPVGTSQISIPELLIITTNTTSPNFGRNCSCLQSNNTSGLLLRDSRAFEPTPAPTLAPAPTPRATPAPAPSNNNNNNTTTNSNTTNSNTTTSSTSSSSSSSGGGVSVGLIAGIVGGVVVVILLAALAVCLIVRKRRRPAGAVVAPAADPGDDPKAAAATALIIPHDDVDPHNPTSGRPRLMDSAFDTDSGVFAYRTYSAAGAGGGGAAGGVPLVVHAALIPPMAIVAAKQHDDEDEAYSKDERFHRGGEGNEEVHSVKIATLQGDSGVYSSDSTANTSQHKQQHYDTDSGQHQQRPPTGAPAYIRSRGSGGYATGSTTNTAMVHTPTSAAGHSGSVSGGGYTPEHSGVHEGYTDASGRPLVVRSVHRVRGIDSSVSSGGMHVWQGSSTEDQSEKHPLKTTTLTPDELASIEAKTDSTMVQVQDVIFDNPPVQLGRGGFGVVFAAQYQGVRVAVKNLASFDNQQRSTNEILVHLQSVIAEVQSLERCNHPNLVRCLGLVANTWPFKLLYELCEGGDLHKQLSSFEGGRRFQWAQRGRFIALDVASALRYLHESLKMVHSDVKSSNILLTADGRAKVGDFGLAKFLKDESDVQHFSKLACSPAYAAPEQLMHQEVSFAVDIFSFGVVLLELLLGQPAPTNRRYPSTTPSDTCPEEIVELVNRCMADHPTARPKIGQVHAILQRHCLAHPTNDIPA